LTLLLVCEDRFYVSALEVASIVKISTCCKMFHIQYVNVNVLMRGTYTVYAIFKGVCK
jgi:hypothetical protein